MILHIPHSSTHIPDDVRLTLILNDQELTAELIKMTDAFTAELFIHPDAVQVVFPVSRLVVDPERFLDDSAEPMASRGMGVVYTKTADGRALRNSLHPAERDSLIERYYIPHHQTLEQMVQVELTKDGTCILVDCHSFPSKPLPCDMDQALTRPQLCIGTDGYHTPPGLIEAVAAVGLQYDINRPYSGTVVPPRYYRKEPRLWSIMIEIRRDLYMDEQTGLKTAGFEVTRSLIQIFLDAIM